MANAASVKATDRAINAYSGRSTGTPEREEHGGLAH